MASTQKKKQTSGTSGNRTASGRSGSGRSTGSRKAPPPPKPIRREVGGIACILLAFFAAFGYFQVEAIFIDFFCNGLKGLIGYGFYLVPPALLCAGIMLLFHRGAPVRLRVISTLMLPVFLGCFLHLVLAKGVFEWNLNLVKQLWDSGMAMESGGAISGVVTIAFIQVFSKIGSGVLFVVGMLILLMLAARLTPMDLVNFFRDRPRAEYEPFEEPEAVEPPLRRRAEEKSDLVAKRRAVIDIPVDEPPVESKIAQGPEDTLKPQKGGFFNRISRVRSPDEVLTGEGESQAEARPEAAPVAPAITVPFDIPGPSQPSQPVVEVVLPPVEHEPAIPKLKKEETAQAAAEVAQDIAANLGHGAPAYQYPPVSLLKEGNGEVGADALGELRANQTRLEDTIHSFGIDAKISGVIRGPSVTRYELELDQGVRLNKLTNLADDIALALGATGVRIAPIPDKISMVGIEVPNKLVTPVPIHEVINSKEFTGQGSKVSFSVGKDIGGNYIVGNIAKLPHLLIAGTTGSGKSVCTNSLIISLLYKSTPDEVRLIMVDPKMVELGIYNGIPHLLIPVVTDPKKAAGALQWAVVEMMKRYRAFAEVGVRDLASYNTVASRTEGMERMPQIVVVIDELADLMLVAAKEVEESICRVAQMGRASGMHLVIATQRPSADVITGLMKANIPSRIAFAVASALESRIILDTTGAEKLVGRGDMLYFPLGAGKPTRVQGCLISDEEVSAVVDFVKQSGSASYDEEILHDIEKRAAEKDKSDKGVGGSAPDGVSDDYDELLPAAIEVVLDLGQASVSMLQRRLKLGYGRAARLVDQMEEKGVVGPFEGSKPRQLLITKEQWQEMQFRQGMVDAVPEPVPEELDFEGDAIPQGREMPPFDMDGGGF